MMDGTAGRLDKVGWYWNRLRRMSGAEIAYRFAKTAQAAAEARGLLGRPAVPAARAEGEPWQLEWDPQAFEAAVYRARADAILEGRIGLLSYRDVEVGASPEWNRNPISGECAPLSYGKTFDYRDATRIGDIKYLWVLNRHHQWVSVAQAFFLTGEDRYLAYIGGQLRSWIDQVPHLRGPNWTSSLELAIRLMNWSFVWQLIGGNQSRLWEEGEGQALRDDWLRSIFLHCHFIRGHLSRFSSANNHLLGELAGLVVAARTWPYWEAVLHSARRARKELIRESLLQNAPDGVNREQSVFYQCFVLDLLLAAGLAEADGPAPMPAEWWQRIERMLEYLAAVTDVGGNVPMIGDADGGAVLDLDPAAVAPESEPLLAVGARLFRRADFAAKVHRPSDKPAWLLGTRPRGEALSQSVTAEPRRVFAHGGYFLLGDAFESREEVRLLIDAGPLGYRSIAAHGHADALSLWLSVGGREVLIDPGTYAYQAHPEWRRYFRGTAAHNTVSIDGMDQAVNGGKFMWLTGYQAECTRFAPGEREDVFVGRHDGYRRLADPVVHERSVRYEKDARRIVVEDTLHCQEVHTVRRHWHVAEGLAVHVLPRGCRAEDAGMSTEIRVLDAASELHLARGEERPACGWVSRRFNEKQPTNTLVCTDRIEGTTCLVTEIRITRK